MGSIDSAGEPVTRWSALRTLRGDESDAAWVWFVGAYETFVSTRLTGLCARFGMRASQTEIRERLVPQFWTYAWERRVDTSADSRQPFRPFLFGCLRNFVRELRQRQPRPAVDVDELESELAHWDEPGSESMAEWAWNVFHNTLDAVRRERVHAAQALELFYGIGARGRPVFRRKLSGSEIGRELGVTDVHGLLHRGRKMFRHLLLQQLMETLEAEGELEHEIGHLRAALADACPGLLPPAS